MDSLRYWISEMHVDGFRFDLASALARELHDVDRLGRLLRHHPAGPGDPQVKLIAEPWDMGEGGYQVGNFPSRWAEWNGAIPRHVRDFWRGEPDMLAELRPPLHRQRRPLRRRRPHARGQHQLRHRPRRLHAATTWSATTTSTTRPTARTTGTARTHNRSWNCGVEGPTDDPAIVALRERQRRNLLATLLLSQGVPMMLAGDEIGRTQRGNNNAYCQDNELSWLDWAAVDAEMLDFTRRLVALRRAHPVFRRRPLVPGGTAGRPRRRATRHRWCRTDGARMDDDDWHIEGAGAIAVFLSGAHLLDGQGQPVEDESFYLALNATAADIAFTLPAWLGSAWECVLDTAAEQPFEARKGEVCPGSKPITARAGRSSWPAGSVTPPHRSVVLRTG